MKHLGAFLAVLLAALVTALAYMGVSWLFILMGAALIYALVFFFNFRRSRRKAQASQSSTSNVSQ